MTEERALQKIERLLEKHLEFPVDYLPESSEDMAERPTDGGGRNQGTRPEYSGNVGTRRNRIGRGLKGRKREEKVKEEETNPD